MKFIHVILSLLFVISPVFAKEDYKVEKQKEAIKEMASILKKGVLKQRENGYVYLDVSNCFITAAVPSIQCSGVIKPNNTSSRAIGAHISVFHESEGVVLEEIGEQFSFDIIDIRSFTVHKRFASKRLWVAAVYSPSLTALREKYGCRPKLKGHTFHITLGRQVPNIATYEALPAAVEFVENAS